jgi:two-component system, cell cycle response regulator CpdR
MAHVLLADDEQATRDLVRRALELDGHSVEAVAGGSEALELLLARPEAFDVLVSDVQMPGIDGIALAQQATAACPRLGVLLMSGFVEQLERGREIKVRKILVVTKPFTLEAVRGLVRELLA